MRVCFAVALPEESAVLEQHAPVLHLGMGKVQAAVALSRELATNTPDLVVNLGTAGGLGGQPFGEVIEIGVVEQHDFAHALFVEFLGRMLPGGPITMPGPPGASGRLVTGDRLVLDPEGRAELASRADVVDMEGYAVAAACERFGVPVWLAKAVSDNADAEAITTWPETLELCGERLLQWAEGHGLLG